MMAASLPSAASAAAEEARHPLDPLTAGEIRQAVHILRRDRGAGERWRFAGIELAEPDKPSLLAWQPGDAVTRHARVTCWNRATAAPTRPRSH